MENATARSATPVCSKTDPVQNVERALGYRKPTPPRFAGNAKSTSLAFVVERPATASAKSLNTDPPATHVHHTSGCQSLARSVAPSPRGSRECAALDMTSACARDAPDPITAPAKPVPVIGSVSSHRTDECCALFASKKVKFPVRRAQGPCQRGGGNSATSATGRRCWKNASEWTAQHSRHPRCPSTSKLSGIGSWPESVRTRRR